MAPTIRDAQREQADHERLVEELAALPESERRAIVREAEEKGRGRAVASWATIDRLTGLVALGGDAVEDCRRAVTEGAPVHGESLEQLEAALSALGADLAPRLEELAEKSTGGLLTPEEHREYAEMLQLTDSLSPLRLKARRLGALRAASRPSHGRRASRSAQHQG